MSCKLSDKCDNVFACNILRPNVELLGCNFYKPKKPMTNEEWLRSCPPQELMRFLMNVAYGGQIRNVQKRTFDEEAEKWCEWLKEIHHAE